MENLIKVLLIIAGVVLIAGFLVWLGLQVRPQPFPVYPESSHTLDTIPLPAGLPEPVERFYRTVYGDEVPIIETVVLQGKGVMKPVMNIPLPARFVFVHNAGRDYRHYFEATLFGIPLMKVDEGYIDGASFFESPMGNYYDEPNANQGANLAVWAEASWFPSLWVTDPRVRWEPVDERTALLYVPFGEEEENFVVRFNPETGLIDMMEAMRYRDNGEGQPKILWITHNDDSRGTLPGSKLSAGGSVMWLDHGRPWANFYVENLIFNVDVSTFIRERGYSID